jgi:hypothetical protein
MEVYLNMIFVFLLFSLLLSFLWVQFLEENIMDNEDVNVTLHDDLIGGLIGG